MNRRNFLSTLTGGAFLIGTGCSMGSATPAAENFAAVTPRLHGFNLLEMFNAGSPYTRYREEDFDIIAEWGMNFVRLPLSYRFWSKPDPQQWTTIDPFPIEDNVARAIDLASARGIHVSLNMHRIPGYCVNPPAEPLDLWSNDVALDAAAHHWSYLTTRFKDVSPRNLSFNLINEPGDIPDDTYARVHNRLIETIRAIDPDRPIVLDGKMWGNAPVVRQFGPNVAFSTRGYTPRAVTHYRAPWLDDAWVRPEWPMRTVKDNRTVIDDKEAIRRTIIEPFPAVQKLGMGVHIGEFGCFNRTPHDVVLKWMIDNLALYKEAGWGWAMWNLRGEFGILDSGRTDIRYTDFRGHKLDSQMLELLRRDLAA